ncbi:DUF3240 family protein [Roseibacillus persicicus]|uniref:DUF3240 family protein n=1 Tax=Roseibacillus persicicus TaxID=454148 RepID=UPI00280C62F9|nr:DUF3240 family protein [Roseibacillus persicicus]MDQ8189820.1 hypothetical protein [Roseibacillus persicicus]
MSQTTTMKLLTIVTENLLKEQIITLLKEHHITGFTISRVEGEGSRGVRASDWEGPNLKIEAIISPQGAEQILERISAQFFDNYAVIAWLSDVAVLRGDKFAQPSQSKSS